MPPDLLEILAALRGTPSNTTVGLTARRLAEQLGRRVLDVQTDLDRLLRDGLVSVERDPIGSEWWSVTAGADLAAESAAQEALL